ncbi:MAG: GntR family transcriptional regulator [Pseudomonadota bacterium]
MTSLRKQKEISHKRADYVYAQLKQQLITGQLPAGTRVDVNQLVLEMETSRQPVLAAINRLASEGFFRVVPQVGCWVATVKEQEIVDFFRLFALTEGLSCELAAQRRTAAGVAALRAILAETARLLETESDPKALAQQFFKLNRDFHGQIHDMAMSDFVGDLAGGMWDRCDFYLASADPGIQGERVVVSEREHEDVVDAIEAGDAATARRLMVEHLESFGEAAVKLLGVGQKLAA